ncbi:MAG: PhoU domain-containing protein [Kiritimatiellia bacterium]
MFEDGLVEFGLTKQIFTHPLEKARPKTTSPADRLTPRSSFHDHALRHARGGKPEAEILALGGLVEESVFEPGPLQPFRQQFKDLAREVVRRDDEIDELEIDIEEDCLKILALHWPVAVDLRFIVSVLKINGGRSASATSPSTSPGARSCFRLRSRFPRPDILNTMAEKAAPCCATPRRPVDLHWPGTATWPSRCCRRTMMSSTMNRQVYDSIRAALKATATSHHPHAHRRHATERIADHATNIAWTSSTSSKAPSSATPSRA